MAETLQQTINEHVARRVHARRVELGMTQKKVAEELGVSFQQFQKYEHARNRLSAGRLYQLADIFDTPITYFFEGYQSEAIERTRLPESAIDTLASARLVKQFESIPSPALKQSVLNVIRALEPGR